MSTLTLPPIENRIPESAVVVSIKICENCGRNFQRCAGSTKVLCCYCFAQVNTPDNQVWRCAECATWRAWGTGRPDETVDKWLWCIRCGTSTEHRFVLVVR